MGDAAMTNPDPIADAVRAERESGDKHFVTERASYGQVPGLRQALAREAKESGRMFVVETRATPNADALAKVQARQTSTVDRSDHGAFLANLADIAAGRVGVK